MMRALIVVLLACQLHSQEPRVAEQEPSFAFLAEPPLGLPVMPRPEGYEPTQAMFELGKRLYHDDLLSVDRSISCASCHPTPGFASAEPRPLGVAGRRAKIHAPSLFNRGYGTLQRWDGSSPSLESFVLEPISDPNEMALPLTEALTRLRRNADYRARFQATFGRAPDALGMRQALSTFVRGIVRGDAPYDRFLRGDREAMSPLERTGFWIFESKGQCWQCHTPGLFTDEKFHNTGVGVKDDVPEQGRAAATGQEEDLGRFKTPTLRGVSLNAPYMHDGSLATLRDVVEFYARGGNANPHLSTRLAPLSLTREDQDALIAFLSSL